MGLFLEVLHRFIILLVICGFTAMYAEHKRLSLSNFVYIQYCPPLYSENSEFTDYYYLEKQNSNNNVQNEDSMLLWTPSKKLQKLKQGRTPGIDHECQESNYDIINQIKSVFTIIFSIFCLDANQIPSFLLPEYEANPKLIYACKEPAPLITVPETIYGYFTWIWTHRVDPNVFWRHFVIYDEKSTEILEESGKQNVFKLINSIESNARDKMVWVKHLNPYPEDVLEHIKRKNKAVVWFRSNCKIFNWKAFFYPHIRSFLSKYNLTIDIIGCGDKRCKSKESCLEIVDKDYYFYLAYESEMKMNNDDDITLAMQNFAVPILIGADESRFLPPGSYINSANLSLEDLSKKIHYLISNKTEYLNFFKWKGHYTYNEMPTTELCS